MNRSFPSSEGYFSYPGESSEEAVLPLLQPEDFRDFSRVRSSVCLKLIGKECFAALPEPVPHRFFLDLVLVYELAVFVEGELAGTGLILDRHLKVWQIKEEQLYRVASRNTPRIFPRVIRPIADFLGDRIPQSPPFPTENALPMYVITNRAGFHGAAAILEPACLAELQARFSSFYLLPSSIHEMILIPECAVSGPTEIGRIFIGLSRSQTLPHEYLTDHIYHCNESGQLQVVEL